MAHTRFSIRNCHNPIGVAVSLNPIPRVAAKPGNPGLCCVTASRLKLQSSSINVFSTYFEPLSPAIFLACSISPETV
jgi:hypothetical protein